MIDQVEARTKDIMFTKKANAYKKKKGMKAREGERIIVQCSKQKKSRCTYLSIHVDRTRRGLQMSLQ
jgi:hypothetical protein